MEDSSDENTTASPALEFDAFMDEIGAPPAASLPIEILVAWGVDDETCALEANEDVRNQLEYWCSLADFLAPARPPGPGLWWYRGKQTFTAGVIYDMITAGDDFDLTGEWSPGSWPADSKRGWMTIEEVRAGFEGLTTMQLMSVTRLLGVEGGKPSAAARTLGAAHVAYSPEIVGLIEAELRNRGFRRVEAHRG